MDFVSKVNSLVRRYSFDHHGFARLERPLSIDLYKDWLNKGHHGDMTYLESHFEMKENPQKLAPQAVSAIVLGKPYWPHPYPQTARELKLRTALYAKGGDYHSELKAEVENLAAALRLDFPSHEFLCFTDSSPILERDLAYRAGLGWVGKNTCLIHPQKGSLFFLAQILTTLPLLAETAPIADFCGSCDRCIQACPTQAIEAPRSLNATKCISFWNIEAKTNAPAELRPLIGDWFFGCDICQTVCPWNEKSFGKEQMRQFSLPAATPASIEDLRWILQSSNKTLARQFQSSPLSRARPRGLKRNAMVLIGNLKLSELQVEVESYVDDPHLNEIARWALSQLI